MGDTKNGPGQHPGSVYVRYESGSYLMVLTSFCTPLLR